jgi:Domain of unknown function (DUF4395)
VQLRLLFGGGPSPLGQLSRSIVFFIEPHFVPGFPNQFAAFAACTLSGLSALFYLLAFDDTANIAGAVVAGILMGAAFLECALDFCASCWTFGLAVTYGILPRNIYTLSTNTKAEAEYAYREATKTVDLMPTEVETFPFPGHPASVIDYRYKTKNDDNERQEFHIVKHAKVTHFLMSLGGMALGTAWRTASQAQNGMHIGGTTSDVLTVAATVVFLLQLMTYAVKAVQYPQKVRKVRLLWVLFQGFSSIKKSEELMHN